MYDKKLAQFRSFAKFSFMYGCVMINRDAILGLYATMLSSVSLSISLMSSPRSECMCGVLHREYFSSMIDCTMVAGGMIPSL